MAGPRGAAGGAGQGAGRHAGGLAVCCSGGGIRSASYNLGALQALARDGTLERDVTLVTAVSGGSYTASSWLLLAAPGPDGEQVPLGEVYRPGSPEERHLRRSTRYLLPTAASALRGGLCVAFGLALNLSLLAGWLVAVLLPVGWWLRERGVTRVEAGSVALHLGARGAAALPWVVPAALGPDPGAVRRERWRRQRGARQALPRRRGGGLPAGAGVQPGRRGARLGRPVGVLRRGAAGDGRQRSGGARHGVRAAAGALAGRVRLPRARGAGGGEPHRRGGGPGLVVPGAAGHRAPGARRAAR